MKTPGTLISATDVSFRYDMQGPMVLEHVDVKVHPGSRVGLVGRNGDGKSTLLQLLVGRELKGHPDVIGLRSSVLRPSEPC